ncbi:cytochrome c oxidase, cbb3-type, subunit III [Candidatus Endolissoclinum faulkneri L2]|uniref:Cbb3-type cytochrome c oxidase subunit n=1 Tax=Candidatus Endolissoclinum faulkneri L2 TaxID=1193729 RepID=K7YGW8_9PROT|nr:cytochrome-c oxidase, cbb3-type subunit III [Candidatus Endolissoclinum faulkneri]AFX98810.1 cytochrome c oxidase, cbb3-type, subunit III [Candidatus Endolissoclinum faulkneri L2]
MSKKEDHVVNKVETTGYEWDGIKELNNPLPRWWLYVFYTTILFAICYAVYYPAIPLIERNTEGLSNYSSRKELENEMAAVKSSHATMLELIKTMDVSDIQSDPKLARFAAAGGASNFKVYCSQCHGSGAQGGVGYPNLNDDDWLWGGSINQIETTIRHGIRYEADEDTRYSEMPAFGRDQILSEEQIIAVANYVCSLSGLEHEESVIALGAMVFTENCSSCHGDDGKGINEVGAPNLADKLWLYDKSKKAILSQIINPQHGIMPAWGNRLGDIIVKELAVYVHGLGGGE